MELGGQNLTFEFVVLWKEFKFNSTVFDMRTDSGDERVLCLNRDAEGNLFLESYNSTLYWFI